jgi:hypothetical protein
MAGDLASLSGQGCVCALLGLAALQDPDYPGLVPLEAPFCHLDTVMTTITAGLAIRTGHPAKHHPRCVSALARYVQSSG